MTRAEDKRTDQTRRLAPWIAIYTSMALCYLWRLTDIARRQEVLATDYAVFLTGWSLIVGGRSHALYDVDAQRAMQKALVHPFTFRGELMGFLTPPHAALILSPFGWLDIQVGFYVWTVLQIGLLVLFTRALLRLVPVARTAERALIVMALLAFWPVFYTLTIGQLSILLALAFVQLFFALRDNRPRRAALWLLVLSFKPQLLPFLLVLLVARRQLAALAWTMVFGAAAAVAAGVALGPAIWRDYFGSLGRLEAFFGNGVPRYMLNLRGAIDSVGAIAGNNCDRIAVRVAWVVLAAALPVAYVAWRRAARVRGGDSLEASFAQATALALFLSPHLFMQDALAWTIPLALFYRQQPRSSAAASNVARFALAWPIVFAVSIVIDNAFPRQPTVSGALVLMLALLAWMFAHSSGAKIVGSRAP